MFLLFLCIAPNTPPPPTKHPPPPTKPQPPHENPPPPPTTNPRTPRKPPKSQPTPTPTHTKTTNQHTPPHSTNHTPPSTHTTTHHTSQTPTTLRLRGPRHYRTVPTKHLTSQLRRQPRAHKSLPSFIRPTHHPARRPRVKSHWTPVRHHRRLRNSHHRPSSASTGATSWTPGRRPPPRTDQRHPEHIHASALQNPPPHMLSPPGASPPMTYPTTADGQSLRVSHTLVFSRAFFHS
ncbi:hypothetical protein HNY73_001774 [Argiope bruennichi]|uniref:Uncharacterized protein n=1 Tax=Argiope bruennichi TaxID=94029 RepID=A0A8T0FVP7_ARGBR|nr:hypothetical protein HNY73_001774 [Argiope bruennichi]